MRGWIPPIPLGLGVVAFGLSWIALFALARTDWLGPSYLAYGWIHLVALGWISLVTLSVLVHALPTFLDVEWRARAVAVRATLVFAIGVAALLVGFFASDAIAQQIGATFAFGALLVYAITAVQPLADAMRGDRVMRAVGRAFAITIAFLIIASALGTAFTYAIGGHLPSSLLDALPPAHVVLGIGGWITLLIAGVSARTMAPIAGGRSRWIPMHILSGSALFLGTVAAAAGFAWQVHGLALGGAVLLIVGACAYAVDMGDIMRRATVAHRQPQALMLCASAFVVAAAVLVLCSVCGLPFAAAAIYASFIGWAGNAMLAHLHHIGVRVVLTTTLGEDDETRPDAVLTGSLTWTTVVLYECAAVVGTIALARNAPFALEIAAVLGFLAFFTMAANIVMAIGKARRLPIAMLTVRRI